MIDEKRLADIKRLIERMSTPQGLLQVVLQSDAGRYLVRELVGEEAVVAHEREPPEG